MVWKLIGNDWEVTNQKKKKKNKLGIPWTALNVDITNVEDNSRYQKKGESSL